MDAERMIENLLGESGFDRDPEDRAASAAESGKLNGTNEEEEGR